MKAKQIQEIVDYYSKKYNELRAENNGELAHAGHIFGNIIPGMQLDFIHWADKREGWKEKRKDFAAYVATLRTYLGLLNEHYHFKHDELTQIEGHFPDMEDSVVSPQNYVEEARRRLGLKKRLISK